MATALLWYLRILFGVVALYLLGGIIDSSIVMFRDWHQRRRDRANGGKG